MTSKLTRDRLAEIAQFGFSSAIKPANDFEIKELARLALAAMESEPHTDDESSNLLWYSQEATCHSDPNYYCEFQRLATPGLIAGIIRELQERRKADSEPVAEVLSNRPGNDTSTIDRALPVGTQLYRHAQPAKDREQVRSEHAEWSQATFGNVGPVGPLKHLSKEALESAAEPGDLSEWADMQFLLWDAQRRAGITDEQITQAMIEKLAVNKQREWPEPKDGEPRLHIKAQPAPVVLDEVTAEYCPALVKYDVTEVDEAWARGFNACRAAMLQVSPVCTCPSGDGSLRWPCPVHPGNSPTQSDCSPAQNGVFPAQGQGWIPVSEQMPDENAEQQILACFKGGDISALYYSDGRWDDAYGIVPIRQDVTHWMPLPAAPQEVKGE